jgi:hypothetical protein
MLGPSNFNQIGPCVTDGTKFIVWRFPNPTNAVDIYYWSAFNSFTTQFTTTSMVPLGNNGVFCKIVQDATHRTFYQADRRMRNWTQVFQQTALTSFTETQAGFFCNADSTTPAIIEGFHLVLS